MATPQQHNQIIRCVFNGNKHLQHVLSAKDINEMTMIEGRFPLTKLPVCGHCEKLGLWHKDPISRKIVGVCRSCGSITKHPVTYSTYLAKKMDVDATGDTFRRMATVDKNRDAVNRFVYLPDFKMDGTVTEDGSKTEQAKRFREKLKHQNLQREKFETRRGRKIRQNG